MVIRYILTLLVFSNMTSLYAQPDQELVYGSYYGGLNLDVVEDIVEMESGGFAICGGTESTTGLSTGGAFQMSSSGVYSGFLALFDENKERLWSTYFGGSGVVSPTGGLVALSDESLIMAGGTMAENIATEGAYQSSIGELVQAGFLCRFSNEGQLLWSTYLGGGQNNSFTTIRGLVNLPEDDVVVVGFTTSSEFPVSEGALQPDHNGSYDGFITRLDSDGFPVWSTFFGGEGADRIHSVATDSESNLIILGSTESAEQISTTTSHQSDYAGNRDLFLLKLSSSGEFIWSTYVGGEGEESQSFGSVTIDNDDNIYIAAKTGSINGIASPGAHQTDLLGEIEPIENIFINKFSSDGSRLWGTYYGSNSGNTSRALEIHAGQLILSGQTVMSSDIVLGDPWLSDFPSGATTCAYLTAFSSDGEALWGTLFGGEGAEAPFALRKFSDNTIAMVGLTSSSDGIATPDGFQTQNQDADGFFSFFQINDGTGISDHEVFDLSVFPNPTRNAVQLNLPPEFVFRADVTVYNSVGQVVAEYANYNALQRLPMNHPTGIYIVEARNSNRVARSKVIVE